MSAPGIARGSAVPCPTGSTRALTESCRAKWKAAPAKAAASPPFPRKQHQSFPERVAWAGEASLGACKPALLAAKPWSRDVLGVQELQAATPRDFWWNIELRGLMVLRKTFCDCSPCTERRVGQNSTRGYFDGVSQPQYDFFFMEPFPRLLRNKLKLFTNPCIPIHVFCGQEGFISIMQTLFTWFGRWTKGRQWTSFLAADQHVRLTHTLLLGFTPGLSSQLLCESLTLNLSRISRLQVQIPSAFHHLLLATFSSCGSLTPLAPHFLSKNVPIPCSGSSHPLFHPSSLLPSGLLYCPPEFKILVMVLVKLLKQLCDILHISQHFEKWDFDELSLLTEGLDFW